MTFTPPNTFEQGTAIDALEHEQNWQSLTSHVNTELLNRNGTVAMASGSHVTLSGAPTSDLHAATKLYVDTIPCPAGTVLPFAGAAAPSGWALCQGQSYATSTYPKLFAAIGYTYGGSGANFNIPDMRSRFPVGKGASTWSDALNEKGGTSTLGIVNHTHDQGTLVVSNHDHASLGGGGEGFVVTGGAGSPDYNFAASAFDDGTPFRTFSKTTLTGTGTVTVTGSTGTTGNVDGVDDNLPPYITLNFIIRLF